VTATHSLPRAEPGTPLYLHLPFCAAKCHYCDFFSVPDEGQDVDGMVGAILAEAEARAPRDPEYVFFGGGTPSLLSAQQWKRLADGLDDLTGFRASAKEVTAECNPESLDEAKATVLLEMGVQRLSIGFQSLHDEVLKLFGRVHTAEDSFRAFAAARAAGVEAINVDMIYAAPGQTVEQWEIDLARVLDQEPDHVSAYNLTFEEETRFQKWLTSGRIKKSPEELELALFETTRRLVSQRGLEPYEISNYAPNGGECQHNLNYWRNGRYVGLGPSAVSKVGHSRGGNTRVIRRYSEGVRSGAGALEWTETLSPSGRLGETWWLGLRLAQGLTPEEARERAGFDGADDPALPIARRLLDVGLLVEAEGRFQLSGAGLPLADGVAAEFLGALSEDPGAPGADGR
jgi:oxygen-independent coproporphyrinogen-3 oxidase